ncbi:MAG: hypothetical protein PSX79_09180 [bacterium]|nr:hypothetical protein [bacterium]
MLRVMSSLIRVQATMSGGAPVGPIAISRRNGGEMAARYEPATGQFLRQDIVGQGIETAVFSSQYAREAANPTAYEIIVSRNEKADARGDEEWNPRSYYRRPFSGDIIEVDSYRAGSHLRHYFAKGGLFHGEYTTFPHIYMGYVNGKTVKCYRDGVETEMKPCLVN